LTFLCFDFSSSHSISHESILIFVAVPDPPDVFSFLDQDSPDEEDDDEDEGEEEHEHEHEYEGEQELNQEYEDPTSEAKPEPQWLSDGIYDSTELPRHPSPPTHESMSSSGSSSLHSDEGSERLADNETDRSTSPERSVKGEEDTAQQDTAAPAGPAASKLASQMLAAHHRQSLHSAFQNFVTPQMARGSAAHPHVPSKALSPRLPHQMHQHGLPRAEKIPITGYDALASKLSNHGTKSSSIKPIYRKFERLNHRLLLHLQDELAELEEQLHRLDNDDTRSRSLFGPNATDIRITPASRRAAAHANPELEWHKIDLINRISYKLGQYSQALTSFNKLTQELDSPDPEAVKKYRHYLEKEQPVIENETRFLDATGDLVALGRKAHAPAPPREIEPAPPAHERKVRFSTEISKPIPSLKPSPSASPSSHLIAVAVAASVLIPILTFTVIPNFFGRMTVVLLVSSGMLGVVIQSGVAGRDFLGQGKQWASCVVVYAIGMVIVAGIFK
jgi:hypothetical protein